MFLIAATAICFIAGLVGVVDLWRHRSARTLLVSMAGLAGCFIAALTAELWFPLFGMNRGDGQVFIGYYLFGAGALGGLVTLGLAAAIALALRPAGNHSSLDAASPANGNNA